MSEPNETAEPSGASGGSMAKHDGSPEPTAHLPGTAHAGCRSRDSDAGTGDTIGRWIPVTERLPDGNVYVIARCRGGQAMEYLYANGRFIRHCEERSVTHWQYFPEPPQDDE